MTQFEEASASLQASGLEPPGIKTKQTNCTADHPDYVQPLHIYCFGPPSTTNGKVLGISTLAMTHPTETKIKIMEIPTSYKQTSTTNGNVLEISTLATTHPTAAKIKIMGISTSYKQMSTTNGNVLEISTLAMTHPTAANIEIMEISTSYKQMSTTNVAHI